MDATWVIAMTCSTLLPMSLMAIVSVMPSPSPTRGDHATPTRTGPPASRSMPKPETTPNESANATEPSIALQPAAFPTTEGSNPGRSPPRTPLWSP